MITLCIFLFTFVLCSAEIELRTAEEPVLKLHDGNFVEATKAHKLIILYFYSPGCGKCIEFAPKFHKAAREAFKREDIKFVFAEINGQVERQTADDFSVVKFPAVKIVRDTLPYSYEGTLEVEGILQNLAQQSSPDYKPPESSLISLTSENFTDFVSSRPLCLVAFLASWCGHCKQMYPHVVEAAKILKKHNIPVIKIAEDQKEIIKNYSVTHFPHLMLTMFNKTREFRLNQRTTDEIVQKVLRFNGPPSHYVTSPGELKVHLRKSHTSSEPVFVAVFAKDSIAEYTEYVEVAKNMSEDKRFAHSYSKDVAQFLDCPSVPCFTVSYNQSFVSTHDKKKIKKNMIHGKESWTAQNIIKFVKENFLPFVGYRDSLSEALEEAYEKTEHLVTIYFLPDFSPVFLPETLRVIKTISDVAAEFPHITFCIANEESRRLELKLVGLDLSGEEVNVAIWHKSIKNKKYRMEEEFGQKSLRRFVKSYVEGKLKRYIFSQPEDKSQDLDRKDGIALVAVGTSFDRLVTSSPTDVLLLLYLTGNGESTEAFNALDQNTVRKIQKMGIRVVTLELSYNDLPEEFIPEKAATIEYVRHGVDFPDKVKVFSDKFTGKNVLKFVQDSQPKPEAKQSEAKTTESKKDEL